METLGQLWKNVNYSSKTKFRFLDWNHKTKYFQISGLSHDGKSYLGILNTGEAYEIPVDSQFWAEYYPGDEDNARAV